jgi:hypothetical protein
LLEAHRDVHRGARREWLAGRGVAGEYLARVDPDPHLEFQPVFPAELRVERDQGLGKVTR